LACHLSADTVDGCHNNMSTLSRPFPFRVNKILWLILFDLPMRLSWMSAQMPTRLFAEHLCEIMVAANSTLTNLHYVLLQTY